MKKYNLIYRPDDIFGAIVEKIPAVVLPHSGLHCTVCCFRLNQENEQELVKRILKQEIPRFHMSRIENVAHHPTNRTIAWFDQQQELQKLHEQMLAHVKFVGGEPLTYRDDYQPHITLSKSHVPLEDTRDLRQRDVHLTAFQLIRKNDHNGTWSQVRQFTT